MSVPASVVERAVEAILDGDLDFAVDLLIGGLAESPKPAGVRCRCCQQVFDWPGLRDAHEARTHGYYGDDALEAAA